MDFEWEALPASVREGMDWLGKFRPTVGIKASEIEVTMHIDLGDSVRIRLRSSDLRSLSASALAFANWLEGRARQHEEKTKELLKEGSQ